MKSFIFMHLGTPNNIEMRVLVWRREGSFLYLRTPQDTEIYGFINIG